MLSFKYIHYYNITHSHLAIDTWHRFCMIRRRKEHEVKVLQIPLFLFKFYIFDTRSHVLLCNWHHNLIISLQISHFLFNAWKISRCDTFQKVPKSSFWLSLPQACSFLKGKKKRKRRRHFPPQIPSFCGTVGSAYTDPWIEKRGLYKSEFLGK